MPSGFVERWKGKITPARIDVGSGGLRQFAVQSSAATSTAVNSLSNSGLSILVDSSGSAVFTLQGPVAGIEKTITFSTLSSGAIIASTGATFDGTNPVIKYLSTVAGQPVPGQTLNLIGISTARWAITGMFPFSTTAWLLSATT
jgi:hypothetical protein